MLRKFAAAVGCSVKSLFEPMTSIQFLDLLRRSQLVDDDELRNFLQLPSDADQLAAAIVEAGLITPWQAEKLLSGKFKGFMLGDYTILRRLRKHEVGYDYLAEHTRMRHKVVLSVALPVLGTDPTKLDRFRTDSGIGEVHQEGGMYYIVRPFIEGLEEGSESSD